MFSDYKILTKLLSGHLLIPIIISSDQTDFVPGRQSFYNMWHLLNVLYSWHSSHQAEVLLIGSSGRTLLLFLGNLVLVPHLFLGLDCYMQLQRPQCTLTQLRFFPLYHGVRQGRWLSPCLFNLAIEPLAIALRTDEMHVPGIKRGLYSDLIVH